MPIDGRGVHASADAQEWHFGKYIYTRYVFTATVAARFRDILPAFVSFVPASACVPQLWDTDFRLVLWGSVAFCVVPFRSATFWDADLRRSFGIASIAKPTQCLLFSPSLAPATYAPLALHDTSLHAIPGTSPSLAPAVFATLLPTLCTSLHSFRRGHFTRAPFAKHFHNIRGSDRHHTHLNVFHTYDATPLQVACSGQSGSNRYTPFRSTLGCRLWGPVL